MDWQTFHKALGPRLKSLKADLESGSGNTPDFSRFCERAQLCKYSRVNLMLIYLQRPDAVYCAGYHEWRKLGRQVRKGEHGISIWIPCRAAKDTARPGDEPELYFRLGTVFDVSQTDSIAGLEYAAPAELQQVLAA